MDNFSNLAGVQAEEVLRKKVVSFGTGAIVYAPKKWIGKNALLVLPKQDLNEQIFSSIGNNLPNVLGIFLTGSFARKEQSIDSDFDVLVVSSEKFKPKKVNELDLTIVQIDDLKKSLKENPVMFYPMISEAKPLFNQLLLDELKLIKPKLKSFSFLIDSTESALKVVEKQLEYDENKENKFFSFSSGIYSMILRLRSLFLLNCFVKEKPYFFKDFKNFLKKQGLTSKELGLILNIYKKEKTDLSVSKEKIPLILAVKLFKISSNQLIKAKRVVGNVKKKHKKRN